MSTIGVIAEYNPFHSGHRYHMEKTREAYGADAPVVCIMSGDFVQRGAPALLCKHARAEAAIRCGASLVLELPLPWSLASAEGFARGAVGLLAATGVVDVVSFGSELGELAPLQAMAEALSDPAVDAAVMEELARGDSYATARQRALTRRLGEAASQIALPNHILAVEYLRAMAAYPALRPYTVARLGSGHDSPEGDETAPRSASALRTLCLAGKGITHWLPEGSAAVLDRERAAGRQPMSETALEQAILSRLRQLRREDFAALPDASEGLEDRLYKAVQSQPGLEEVLAAAKSRRYAMSRLRRMCLCGALGVKREDAAGVPPYLRVLGADQRGQALLRQMTKQAKLPILTRPAAGRRLDEKTAHILSLTAAARDLYCLGWIDRAMRTPGSDWKQPPFMSR